MGLRDDIQQDLAEAMDNDLADVVSSFVLKKVTQGTYNSTTDTYDPTEATFPGRGVFSALPVERLQEENVKPGDEILIVNAIDCEGIFAVDDELTTTGSLIYRVIVSQKIPGGDQPTIAWKLVVRLRGG